MGHIRTVHCSKSVLRFQLLKTIFYCDIFDIDQQCFLEPEYQLSCLDLEYFFGLFYLDDHITTELELVSHNFVEVTVFYFTLVSLVEFISFSLGVFVKSNSIFFCISKF